MPLTTTSDVSSLIQTYYSRKLLEQIVPNTIYAQFGKKESLPQNAGSASVRFFRFSDIDPTNLGVVSLTEGQSPAQASWAQMTVNYVDVTLSQYGRVVGITSNLDAVGLIKFFDNATEQNAKALAVFIDITIRNELAANHTGKNVILSGGAANYATLQGASSPDNYVCTPTDIADAATKLKLQHAPMEGGYYFAVMSTQQVRDLMVKDNVWQRVVSYQDAEKLYRGEVGALFGVRVAESALAFRSGSNQYTYDASGNVFSGHVFANPAFGVVDLQSYSPFAPQVYIISSADKADPLNMYKTVGFKVWFAAKVLQPKWLCQIYSRTLVS